MLINSTYGLIVYSRNKGNGTNLLFFILTITISLWGLAMLGYRGFSDHASVLLMSRLLYFFAIMIPIAFLYFVIVFPNPDARVNVYQKYLAPILPIILCVLSLYPAGFISNVILYENRETFIIFNQLTHMLFGLYVVIYFSWAYWILYKKYEQADITLKTQLGYIFVGTFGSTTITLITNLGLLYFGYFNFNWVGQVGIIFMITFIFYSISKHHLFNIKLIAVEMVTFSLWIFMLIRVILSTTLKTALIEGGIFALTLIFGIILIRSVLHEIKQRQRIEEMAGDLKSAYETIRELRVGLEDSAGNAEKIG